MSEVKFNEKEMELFLLGVQEDNKRITELEAENKRLRELLKEAILNYEDMWFFKELSETLEALEQSDA